MESNDRLNLESALAQWRAASALDDDTLAELEAHLRDACAAGTARGLPPEETFREALAQLGEPAQLTAEFSKLETNRSPNTMHTAIASLVHSPRLRRLARQLVIALVFAIPLRVFAIAPYRVAGACVAPEIPAGSHLLVWRIAPTFAPGDIVAFRNGSQAWLGRVTAVSSTNLIVARASEPARSVPRADVIGRVVLTTR